MRRGPVVTKSSPVVVVPSESEKTTAPLAGDTVALSSFDMCMLPFPTRLLIAFDRPIHEPAETIRRALSLALAHYHPVAGRLDGEGGIACTGEGVPFVAALASCALGDAMATLQQMDLTISCPGVFCRDVVDPLLLVQVTEFSCGGYVVGVTWNHILADGAGMGQFLTAVGELARGVSPPSVAPVRRWDEALLRLPASVIAAQRSTAADTSGAPPRRSLARHDIALPPSLIARVKGESGCTAFEAVTAAIWRSRARATMSGGGAAPPRRSPSCATRAKEDVPDLLSRLSGGGGGGGTATTAAAEGRRPEWYSGLVVISWMNLGIDAADFGGGRPSRVMWHEELALFPCCIVCPPCKGEALNVCSLCVKPEHSDAFLGEVTKLSHGDLI
ncbi:hypothetical protein U9M48_037017 [Paspalum notatum var. saurae]|uniref:Uncharacterized protein n=1 Tax=Paspalum notatum var. saurae TaxID=547442 RepID=A0AAQ3UKA5_PASNO